MNTLFRYAQVIKQKNLPFLKGKFCQRWMHAECLENRSIINVHGENVDEFLQGLITNDIDHITQQQSSMYTMFLNVQGRVLFDGIIYNQKKDSYIIDCDANAMQPLINHLKIYRVRKKINFESLDNMYKVWVVYDDNINMETISHTNLETLYIYPNSGTVSSIENFLPENSIITRDPRLKCLGDRILLPCKHSLQGISDVTISTGNFRKLRYKLGVGEGVDDLPRDKCLPLEANCDYLHGVSFQKGCYIGQELTARTFHTGIIRKRYMPLIFQEKVSFEKNAKIFNEKEKSVGKIINVEDKYGIALMRVAECLNAQSLKVGTFEVKTFRPGWWPLEVSKEKR